MGKRGPSCSNCWRSCWTVCFVVLWVLVVIGLVLCHVAIADAVGPIGDLPSEIEAGFYESLKFNKLEEDATQVRDSAQSAIALCNPLAAPPGSSRCSSDAGALMVFYDTSTQLSAISDAFDSSLTIIDKVVSDIYFGVEDLKATADSITEIKAEFNDLQGRAQPLPCAVSQPLYCTIFEQANTIITEKQNVDAQIKEFTEGDEVESFESRTSYLNGMHVVPYILVIGMLFFTCFWYKDATLCNSMTGVCAELLFLLFWVVALVLNTIVVAIGSAVAFASEDISIPASSSGLNLDATLRELLDHIETEFPEFYSRVFQPLSDPLLMLLRGTLVFEVFLILIVLYGMCLCCCRPYRESGNSSVSPEPDAKK
mmetsp:Transcript_7956/g.17677  ORF Transcript_7956/g.17677 Transcript_7956/m.17677 type:complete len:369 (+) Transcript_7956:94-1200(+)|eukprot:CAMPEP_0178444544 /NCGR_PEP_ID=MMETSP0689_2-20121128/39582_1 /TAXON_ID=160604 /ORGANISM="Amphidinium massartii, Strain CS-259" /LENGTH=368 /DNA_ID=CAMNT_0020068819 /DNA_START=74 /DNA_END=1180 /DNA_ORIENTATION=+